MASRFENQLKALPAKPGVYLFRDKAGDVLYVGKAKSLRPRVRSYFQQSQDTRTTIQQLPDRVEDIEVIVTGSEVASLLLRAANYGAERAAKEPPGDEQCKSYGAAVIMRVPGRIYASPELIDALILVRLHERPTEEHRNAQTEQQTPARKIL